MNDRLMLTRPPGADNLFDTYPDPVPTTLNTTGNTPYSNYAPFGRGGRFAYARATDAFGRAHRTPGPVPCAFC